MQDFSIIRTSTTSPSAPVWRLKNSSTIQPPEKPVSVRSRGMSGPARLRLCLQHAGDQLPKSIQEDGYEITFQQVGNGSREGSADCPRETGKRLPAVDDGRISCSSWDRRSRSERFECCQFDRPAVTWPRLDFITGFSELLAFASPTAPVVRVEPLPESVPASQDRATLAVIFLVEHLWTRNSAGIFIRLCVLRRRRASPVECRSD